MIFEAPQIIYTALILIGIGISLARLGEKRESTYGLDDVILTPAISFGLLYWGGFFGG